eukprot:7638016-Ditylum_brightwellii.AAC.1
MTSTGYMVESEADEGSNEVEILRGEVEGKLSQCLQNMFSRPSQIPRYSAEHVSTVNNDIPSGGDCESSERTNDNPSMQMNTSDIEISPEEALVKNDHDNGTTQLQ